MKRTKKQPARPDPPTLERAIELAQAAADASMLGQSPYASFVAGFGWIVDSTCGSYPSNADHTYLVTVLPSTYFRKSVALW